MDRHNTAETYRCDTLTWPGNIFQALNDFRKFCKDLSTNPGTMPVKIAQSRSTGYMIYRISYTVYVVYE